MQTSLKFIDYELNNNNQGVQGTSNDSETESIELYSKALEYEKIIKARMSIQNKSLVVSIPGKDIDAKYIFPIEDVREVVSQLFS